jgi:H+/gluconate symporter-like permease
MSKKTTETARAVMFCSLATVPPGLIAVAVMVASEHANPTVIGMICAAPAAIAVPILALARLLRRAEQAAPAEIHQTYTGTVYQDQRNVHTTTRGVWARTNNQQ